MSVGDGPASPGQEGPAVGGAPGDSAPLGPEMSMEVTASCGRQVASRSGMAWEGPLRQTHLESQGPCHPPEEGRHPQATGAGG